MVRRLGLRKTNHLTYASLALNPRYILHASSPKFWWLSFVFFTASITKANVHIFLSFISIYFQFNLTYTSVIWSFWLKGRSLNPFQGRSAVAILLCLHLWFKMWHLFCPYLFLISPSFGTLGGLCFVIVAFPGYLRIHLLISLLQLFYICLFNTCWFSPFLYLCLSENSYCS